MVGGTGAINLDKSNPYQHLQGLTTTMKRLKDHSSTALETGDTASRQRRLSPFFVQFLMVLNGVILTVMAYFVLHLFIKDILQEEYARVTDSTSRTIKMGVVDMEHSLDTVASLLILAQNTDRDVIIDNIRNMNAGLDVFDQVLWVYESKPGIWQYKEVYSHPRLREDGQYMLKPDPDFIKQLLAGKYFDKPDLTLVHDFKGMEYVVENEEPKFFARPFALIENIHPGDLQAGMVIGVTRLGNILSHDWSKENLALAQLTIHDEQTQENLFHMERNEKPSSGLGTHNSHLKMGDSKLKITMAFARHKNVIFLEFVPYIVAGLGIILMIGGVMYVRANQNQSETLTGMNMTLEGKNKELEKEVTERERLNRALRRSERENRAIIDAVSDIIFETNTDGEILFLNSTWRKLTGFDPEQFKRHDLFSMLHPQDQERQRHDFEQLVKGHKQAYRTFTRLRTADGTFRSVELAMSMIRHDENRNLRVVGTFTDVEERRRAERALSEAEKKYRTIVENAAGGIYQVTPEGLYLSANIALARILGYDSREDVVRINADRNVYIDSRAREMFKRELEEKGSISNRESRARRKDGALIWVNENARVVRDETGSVLYYEGSIEDITQRKETETALRDAKMHSDMANRAKSEFLANMSHELRTPLNAIIGFSEIIAKEMLGPIGNKAYWEYARDIHESGGNLLKIINEILDISKIEAGDRALNESIVDMGKVVRSTIELLGPKAFTGNKTVHNNVGAIPFVIGEETALKQVMLNLLSNAIKFTPPGGSISFTSEIDRDGHLRLSVTDTGIGLDEKGIEKALSPFGQVNNELAREEAGTGLGLTLVMALMKLHGGKFELFSQKGIGTTATIVVPVTRLEWPKGSAKTQAEPAAEPLKTEKHF